MVVVVVGGGGGGDDGGGGGDGWDGGRGRRRGGRRGAGGRRGRGRRRVVGIDRVERWGHLAVDLGLLDAVPHIDQVADLDDPGELLRQVVGDPDAAVRGRVQGNVGGTVHRDPVVEVHRVEHPAEPALTASDDPALVLVHAAGRDRLAALAPLERLGAVLVAVLTGADRDLLAPLGVVAGRDVAHEDRLVALEHDEHLLRQVDLGVAWRLRNLAARIDLDRVLHPIPDLGRDQPLRLLTIGPHHELLERPHGHLGETAELPVDGAGGEPELGQSLLDPRHVVALVAGADGAVGQRLLDDRGVGVDRHHGGRLADRGHRVGGGVGRRRARWR